MRVESKYFNFWLTYYHNIPFWNAMFQNWNLQTWAYSCLLAILLNEKNVPIICYFAFLHIAPEAIKEHALEAIGFTVGTELN